MTKPATAEHLITRGKPERVLLKLSGESFTKPGEFGIDPDELGSIALEVKAAVLEGAKLAVVVGGGNLIRGASLAKAGWMPQATADYMGMLGTVMNAMALREALEAIDIPARVMSALDIRAVAEPFIRLRALRHMDKGRVIILAAGTGNPFFTTDTCASLRAVELECDVLMKATKVDGVYTADPVKDPTATRYDRLTYTEALERGLTIMDAAALAMCREHNLPTLVFDFKRSGNIARAVRGESIGTLVTND